MAVPRNRTSNAKKNSRRAHHAKKPRHLAHCSNCGAAHLPHTICGGCGFYASKSIVTVKE